MAVKRLLNVRCQGSDQSAVDANSAGRRGEKEKKPEKQLEREKAKPVDRNLLRSTYSGLVQAV